MRVNVPFRCRRWRSMARLGRRSWSDTALSSCGSRLMCRLSWHADAGGGCGWIPSESATGVYITWIHLVGWLSCVSGCWVIDPCKPRCITVAWSQNAGRGCSWISCKSATGTTVLIDSLQRDRSVVDLPCQSLQPKEAFVLVFFCTHIYIFIQCI